ncbi:MAG TPA: hypothetical protein DDW52_17870 [Planctomycetaceae bacterium]|nr:hypothetical protein [Planctomycetaceae bacterium]
MGGIGDDRLDVKGNCPRQSTAAAIQNTEIPEQCFPRVSSNKQLVIAYNMLACVSESIAIASL